MRYIAAVLSLLFLGLPALASNAANTKEYQIKAAFVFNFAKFLEWPERCFESAEQAITIGVVGETPLAAELATIVKDRKVRGRSVHVRSMSSTDDLGDLHVLFVGSRYSDAFLALRTTAERRGILTIGETPAFEAAGGMITFLIDGDKVRFAINMYSAEHVQLKISAQLQQLATVVHRSP